MTSYLADADILIDATRGNPHAEAFLEANLAGIFISVVTIAELYAGVRKGKEERAIARMCEVFTKLPVDEDVALSAGRFRNQYGRSHGTGTIDCIVAATAALHQLTLVTLNRKHYPMAERILVPYKKH